MVPYSRITLQQMFDEVIMRLGEHRNPENSDWSTFVRFINHARNEVQAMTVPIKDWAYFTSIQVTDRMVLSPSFIAPVRVMLSLTGAPPYKEARRVDVREWFTMLNADVKHRWNQGTIHNPLYMIWGRILYLYPSNMYSNVGANYSGFMDCYQFPPDAVNPTDTLMIPYEYEELLIALAVDRFATKTSDPQLLSTLTSAVKTERAKTISQYMQKRRSAKRVLEEFVDANQTPFAKPRQEPGELSNRLI